MATSPGALAFLISYELTQNVPCICRRQTRRPTILAADGNIRWPTLGDITLDDSAVAAKPTPVTFPQEMARFADKVPGAGACRTYCPTLFSFRGQF